MSRPSRLHRTVPPGAWSSVLAADAYEAPFLLDDDQVTHYTIHRGSGQRGGGYTASTCEFATPEPALRRSVGGYRCTVGLTEGAAAALAAWTGASAAAITPRWSGRLAVIEVTDRGDGSNLTTSTIRGVSWLTQMVDSLAATSPTKGRRIDGALKDALGITTGTTPRGIELVVRGTPDRVAIGEQDALFWQQFLDKYVADPGYVLRQRRDGVVELLTLTWMTEQAAATTMLPLSRSRAITPATWSMHNERPPRDQHYTHTKPEDDTTETRVYVPQNNVGEINGEVHIDWTHLYDDTDQLHAEARGRAFSESVSSWTVPKVTVDLLALLSSPHDYHHQLAGDLLALEPYDAVPLSGDWPFQTRGIHFAAGITESITPERWTLDLALVPHRHMTGTASPTPRRIIWDHMADPWASTPGQWNSYTL